MITPDRDYFESCGEAARGFTFPATAPGRRVELTGPSVRIGRRSVSRGITPEIDLSSPPVDPCVSHEHARLLAQPDGSWALIDDGSKNGTYLRGSSEPILPGTLVLLADGDRFHLGVWTTITLRAGQ